MDAKTQRVSEGSGWRRSTGNRRHGGSRTSRAADSRYLRPTATFSSAAVKGRPTLLTAFVRTGRECRWRSSNRSPHCPLFREMDGGSWRGPFFPMTKEWPFRPFRWEGGLQSRSPLMPRSIGHPAEFRLRVRRADPDNRSYIIPLTPGEAFPRIPAEGFRSEEEIAKLSGARRIDALTVPGPSPDVYAFYRGTTQRNLYRVPVQ